MNKNNLKPIEKDVTIPKWYYDNLVKDSELVSHLAHYRGYIWIEAVRKEMELDKHCQTGIFKINPMKYYVGVFKNIKCKHKK